MKNPPDTILQTIYSAVDELNQQVSEQLEKSIDTVLFGKGGTLDSLGLVTLIVLTEQKIEEGFGITITLADEKAMSRQNSPFKSIGTLADYIASVLETNSHG